MKKIKMFLVVLVCEITVTGVPIMAADDTAEQPDGEDLPVILEDMEIVGVTPVSGTGIRLDKIPANVQTVTSEDLERTQSLTLPETMFKSLGSVSINEAQANPFQPDVRFRGFTASPLLGIPQGLSVYINSVRFNEPFGDTVNWDLIPEGAIDEMVLHPGSNPLYGLNTLGGAIAIRTKTGFSAPGHQIKGLYGSWERHDVEVSSGDNDGTFGYFFDLRNFGEEGWRDVSKSKVNQGFGAFSWRIESIELDLTLAGNESNLNGNGAAPIQLFELNPSSVFTHPDNTRTALFLSSLDGRWQVTNEIEVSGNAFYRRNRISTFNGDDSDLQACEEEQHEGLLCQAEGDGEAAVIDVNDNPVAATESVTGATNNFSKTHQENYGGSLQSAFMFDLFGMENQLIAGSSYDRGVINFEFDTELGSLTFNRGTTGSGILVDEARVRLHSKTQNWGLYFTDTLSVTEALAVTLAGRYNNTRINMQDRDGDELNGLHIFDRFNPAAGFTYTLARPVTAYARYSESSRAPTPVELSCADSNAPCKLPNAFLSDPPLNQVVAKTWEGGFRGRFDPVIGSHIDWNAGYYHTVNNDDILFISAGELTNEGFFNNVGQTRRQGVEASVTAVFDKPLGNFDQWRFALNYSYIDATFRTPFIASSPNNPSADENGQTQVRSGSRLPGIPEHMVKFSADVDLWNRFSMGFDMVFNSDQFFRGDEANLNDQLTGYAVFGLRAEYRFNQYVSLFGKVDNLFNTRYKTFGLYGEAGEVLGDAFNDPRFVSAGAPRAGWVGVRLSAM